MSAPLLEHARRLLCRLHDTIRDRLTAARNRQARTFARVAAVTAADTIYQIDRLSEAVLEAWLEEHWPRTWPVEVVMEGLETPLTFPRGTPVRATEWKLILDPIDGTRGLMHDKRSAWVLAGLAPQRGARNHLGDMVVAAMTELPVSKQGRADQFSVVRGTGRVVATAVELATGKRRRLPFRPSTATDFRHGFASVSRFFPGAGTWLAGFEEQLWRELGVLGDGMAAAPVFEDQYISCGGQFAELLTGRDRMVIDVRPQAFRALGLPASGLCSHPYDVCTELILREAGVVVESPGGGRLRSPLDTTTPVSWMACANPVLARQVRPVLRRLLGQV